MKRSTITTIGTSLTVIGVIATGYLAYKGGLNARRILDERRDKGIDDEAFEEGREIEGGSAGVIRDIRRRASSIVKSAKPTIRCWVPALISGSATVLVVGFTHHANAATIATLSGLAASSRELYNRAKTELKKDESGLKRYLKDFIPYPEVIRELSDEDILKGNEPEELFYDTFLDQYFMSSQVAVKTMLDQINIFYHENDYVSLYEMYKMIGLPYIVADADLIGWSITDRNAGVRDIWIDTYTLEMDDGEYCTLIDYDYAPDYLG